MYEISNETGIYCLECNKELGYLNPEKKSFYKNSSIKTQSAFSTRIHPKFGKKRQRCFDCAVTKFGSIKYRPNVHHSQFAGYLFDVKIDMSNVGVTLDIMINRYGEKEGKKRFDEYRAKQAYSNTLEYKRKKYGWDKTYFDEFNKSRAITLDNMVAKYGKTEGKKKYDEYRAKQAYSNTLEYFVDKFGYTLGKQEYNRVCNEKAMTLDNMIRIHGKIKGPEIYEKNMNNKNNGLYYSNISQELFKELDKTGNIESSYYGIKNHEFGINAIDRYYFYDYVIPDKRKIIEFNGDYWHANPKLYESHWQHPVSKKYAREIWMEDAKKIDIAINKGYNLFVVWETDYKKNPNEIIKQCVEFLLHEN
jgi:hypothetical protein